MWSLGITCIELGKGSLRFLNRQYFFSVKFIPGLFGGVINVGTYYFVLFVFQLNENHLFLT